MSLSRFIAETVENTLDAYRSQPHFIEEHANHEQDTARGGYANRQLFELVQNGADALAKKEGGGKIVIRLTEKYLYCADNGKPIKKKGILALMFSHISPKRGTKQIGRFGLGFKSVLNISDSPDFYSKLVSFNFDRKYAEELLKPIAPDEPRYPVLRTPRCIDSQEFVSNDEVLAEFTKWASNIIRLPLLPGASQSIEKQMNEFPAEFLLFTEHVHSLRLENSLSCNDKDYKLDYSDGRYFLVDDEVRQEWKLSKRKHRLTQVAIDDRRTLDKGKKVLIQWAAPINRLLQDTGMFWAHFPTTNSSPSLTISLFPASQKPRF